MDWFDHIRSHTYELAALADATDAERQVPTCPGWTMADLVWHLLEVQDFWEHIITKRPTGPDSYVQPPRPADAELAAGLRSACDRLIAALDLADPAEEAWSWSSDHTVGFTYRRQAHEAFVHRADAIATAETPLPVLDPAFAADGIEEILQYNLAGVPDWATFEADSGVVQLRTNDTGNAWTLRFGRMAGTSPNTGTTYTDEPALKRDDAAEPGAVISAPAIELDLWLWGRRPDHVITVSGDASLSRRLREVAQDSTQ